MLSYGPVSASHRILHLAGQAASELTNHRLQANTVPLRPDGTLYLFVLFLMKFLLKLKKYKKNNKIINLFKLFLNKKTFGFLC